MQEGGEEIKVRVLNKGRNAMKDEDRQTKQIIPL
jgi:hypothetical protein